MSGDAYFTVDDLEVMDKSLFQGPATFKGTTTHTGPTTLNGDLTVTGNTHLHDVGAIGNIDTTTISFAGGPQISYTYTFNNANPINVRNSVGPMPGLTYQVNQLAWVKIGRQITCRFYVKFDYPLQGGDAHDFQLLNMALPGFPCVGPIGGSSFDLTATSILNFQPIGLGFSANTWVPYNGLGVAVRSDPILAVDNQVFAGMFTYFV